MEPGYRLGNIGETHLAELVASDAQRRFGQDKLRSLPRYCFECDVRFACHGECPKNRFRTTPDGEPGLNYLCAGWKAFFHHVDRPMRLMASLLRRHRPAEEIMAILAREEAPLREALARAQRNDPCPCGSGRKFKYCHGSPPRPLPDPARGETAPPAVRRAFLNIHWRILTGYHPSLSIPAVIERRHLRNSACVSFAAIARNPVVQDSN